MRRHGAARSSSACRGACTVNPTGPAQPKRIDDAVHVMVRPRAPPSQRIWIGMMPRRRADSESTQTPSGATDSQLPVCRASSTVAAQRPPARANACPAARVSVWGTRRRNHVRRRRHANPPVFPRFLWLLEPNPHLFAIDIAAESAELPLPDQLRRGPGLPRGGWIYPSGGIGRGSSGGSSGYPPAPCKAGGGAGDDSAGWSVP